MVRALAVCLVLVVPVLSACTGASAPSARIVVFSASADRVPIFEEVTLVWQAADAGVQDGFASCLLTRRFDDDATEATVDATCVGSLTEVPPAPVTATAVHYTFQVLEQPGAAAVPYLTATRTVVLDPARFATRGGGADEDSAHAIGVLPDGGAIVVGAFEGTATFGATTLVSAGGTDAFVARIDRVGAWSWARRAGGALGDAATAVSVLPDGSAIVVGGFNGNVSFGAFPLTGSGGTDLFVARIDPDGVWSWASHGGGAASDYGGGVHALPDGGAIVVGSVAGTASFGPNTLPVVGAGLDLVVARVDPTGTWLWARRAGGTGNDVAAAVDVDADGNATVAGTFQGTVAFGSVDLTSAATFASFVARLDPDGNWIWASRGGGVANALTLLPNGSAVVVGAIGTTATFGTTVLDHAGGSDVFVAQVDPTGAWTWAIRAGSTSLDDGEAVTALPDGSVLVTGRFTNDVAFGATTLSSAGLSDLFVARVDADGVWAWARSAGGTSNDGADAVAALPDGGAIVAGYFARSFATGSATFGSTTLTSAGQDDVFVARIGADAAW